MLGIFCPAASTQRFSSFKFQNPIRNRRFYLKKDVYEKIDFIN